MAIFSNMYICTQPTETDDGEEEARALNHPSPLSPPPHTQPVPPGTEGAISLEGTLAGVVGSILMGAAGVALGLVSAASLPLILAAAFVATNVESLLGVWLQNDKYPWATNEFINFLNTLIGAAFAIGVTVAVGGK